jgi:phospholipid/cholesterol/gamma-HCH transport system substrate-binding protein
MVATAESKARWLFGAFLLALAAGAALWWAVSEARWKTYELRTADAVSGLIRGSPVEFHGVEVGKVRAVELLGPRRVRVLLDVQRDAPVTTATTATITGRGMASRGFTGYVYVSLEDTAATGSALAPAAGSPYPVIASAPAQIVSLDTSISELNENVKSATALLQSALDPQTLASLKQSALALEQFTRTLPATSERLVRTMASAERAGAQVDGLARTVNQRLVPVLQNTEQATAQLAPLLQDARQVTAQFVPVLQASGDTLRALNTQLLPEAYRTLANMEQLTGTMQDGADRLRRNPALMLRGVRAPLGPGETP